MITIDSYSTVFELTPTGLVTIFHALTGAPDGQNRSAGLVRHKAGNLYGTTSSGGSGTCVSQGIHGCGIVFQLTPPGKETVLYSFSGEKNQLVPST
ncbi:MAG: choice-of-anchor tandem repeat GloVer-containing protein [Terriglobales bacterium]